MKKVLMKRILAFLLVFAMVIGYVPNGVSIVNAEGTDQTKSGLDTSNVKFDVENPEGYVTVSFEDWGDRENVEDIDDTTLYGEPLGWIIEPVKVPYKAGDNMADVTVRLLDAMGVTYKNTGTIKDSFYLSSIGDFELNGVYYDHLAEFDAGFMSGWCVRLNNWHTDQGASSFEVEDGDSIQWMYSCRMGADIGVDYETKSAEINGITFLEEYGTLDPAFETDEEEYEYIVDKDIKSVAFDLELENYASVVTVTVNGQPVKYRPNQPIAVNSDSLLEISTALDYMDIENNNQVVTYEDTVKIQFSHENHDPVVKEEIPNTAIVKVNKEYKVDVSTFFTDEDEDELTYTVKVNDGEEQEVEKEFSYTATETGEYRIVVTASDGEKSASHTITLTVKENSVPVIKEEYAQTKEKIFVYGNSYVYIYMEDYFEDVDGDALSFEATLDDEKVDITYNSWLKEHYIMFDKKPCVREYKIKAFDGEGYSEEFTAKCIGTSAAISVPEEYQASLIENENHYYYIYNSIKENTFKLDFELDVETDIQPEFTSSNTEAITVNEDGSFTVNNVAARKEVLIGVTYGKDQWNSTLWLGTKYIYLLPANPTVEDVSLNLAEHADKQAIIKVDNAFTGGWYSSEFDYKIEDPSIVDMTTTGLYGLSFTPKALGTTKVTATFKYDASIQIEFNVTVNGRSLQMKDAPNEDSVIYEAGKTVQMEVLGAQEGETFTWTSGDEDIATVDKNGLVTMKKTGPVYITAISSLSTEEAPLTAAMYLQIKEDGKVYLEDIAFEKYNYFGWISEKSGFHASKLSYDMDIAENQYSYATLAFTPYFDEESLNAVLYYQVKGGNYQKKELKNKEKVSISNAFMAGDNEVRIEVASKEEPENVTNYTFHIFRPYNPTNTITGLTVYPGGENALSYPVYNKQKEGTLFQYNEETETLGSYWWTDSSYVYKTYLYGDRTERFSLKPSFGYTEERVMMYVNGKEVEEAVTNWKTSTIPFDGEKVTITFKVLSERAYVEKQAAGIDPYTEPEKVYTVYVENAKPLGLDAKILDAKLEGGQFYEPGFKTNVYSHSILIPNDASSVKMTYTVPADIEVYKNSVYPANKQTAVHTDEDGNSRYELTLSTGTNNIILQSVDPDDETQTGLAQYSFYVVKRGAKDVYPDSIASYLCIGSQYTNSSSYGTMPERTLKNNGDVLSLGNFGGHIIYKYDTPIENDPANPYGVDLVIYGNSFGNGAHEPGYVQVSKDGKTWYTLAGSAHFDDYCDWNYSVTYKNADGKSSWSDSNGESGTIYNYPNAAAYPYYDWTEAKEQTITVYGPRLTSDRKDQFGSAAAALADFGYVDTYRNPSSLNGAAVNPYTRLADAEQVGGDMFDLSWAVDENGLPVELDSISYVKVATASNIYAGAIGEKSTEVSAVTRAKKSADVVGKTEAPVIKVNGETLTKAADGNIYTVAFGVGEVKVEVESVEGAAIYINDADGNSRTYEKVPEKGIIRVIVQEGEKEPYICYIWNSNDLEIANKKAELLEYVSHKDMSEYRKEQQKEIEKALAEGKAALEKAETAEELEKAFLDAKALVNAVKTNAVLEAEEAQAAAEKAKEEEEKARKEAEEAKAEAEAAAKKALEAQKEAEKAAQKAKAEAEAEAQKAKTEAEAAAKKAKEAEKKAETLKKAIKVVGAKPESVTAKATTVKKIEATWKAVTDAEKYKVEVLRNGKSVEVTESATSSYTYTNGKAGYAYTVKVTPMIVCDADVYYGISRSATAITKPAKPDLKVKKSGSKVKLTSKKQTCTGYQIQVSKNKKFKKSVKKYTVKKAALSKTIKLSALAKGKNYIRIRAYKTYEGKTVYSSWSKAKTVQR